MVCSITQGVPGFHINIFHVSPLSTPTLGGVKPPKKCGFNYLFGSITCGFNPVCVQYCVGSIPSGLNPGLVHSHVGSNLHWVQSCFWLKSEGVQSHVGSVVDPNHFDLYPWIYD